LILPLFEKRLLEFESSAGVRELSASAVEVSMPVFVAFVD